MSIFVILCYVVGRSKDREEEWGGLECCFLVVVVGISHISLED